MRMMRKWDAPIIESVPSARIRGYFIAYPLRVRLQSCCLAGDAKRIQQINLSV